MACEPAWPVSELEIEVEVEVARERMCVLITRARASDHFTRDWWDKDKALSSALSNSPSYPLGKEVAVLRHTYIHTCTYIQYIHK